MSAPGESQDEAAYAAWLAGLDERETRKWSYPGLAMRPAFRAGYAAGAAAERARSEAFIRLSVTLCDRFDGMLAEGIAPPEPVLLAYDDWQDALILILNERRAALERA